MGRNAIEKYGKKIMSLFGIGRSGPGKKKRESMIRKTLQKAEKYPYKLPSEQKIFANISTLNRKLKQRNSRNAVLPFCPIIYEKRLTVIIFIFGQARLLSSLEVINYYGPVMMVKLLLVFTTMEVRIMRAR